MRFFEKAFIGAIECPLPVAEIMDLLIAVEVDANVSLQYPLMEKETKAEFFWAEKRGIGSEPGNCASCWFYIPPDEGYHVRCCWNWPVYAVCRVDPEGPYEICSGCLREMIQNLRNDADEAEKELEKG